MRVVVVDRWMDREFLQECKVTGLTGSQGLLMCFVKKPWTAPVYFFKKWIGLFDHFHLSPYAVDAKPAWFRWFSRVLNGFAFAGFFVGLFWLGLFWLGLFWARKSWSVLTEAQKGLAAFLVLLPFFNLVVHSLFRVEARYGFTALPGGILAGALCVAAVVRFVQKCEEKRSLVLGSALVALMALFFVQVWNWDQLDPILQAEPRHPVAERQNNPG